MRHKFSDKNLLFFKIIIVFIILIIFFLINHIPKILISFCYVKEITKYGEYLYKEENKIIYDSNLDQYMIDPENKIGLKNIIIIGCDKVESENGNSGSDIVILVSRRKNGEIHIFNLNRDLFMTSYDNNYVDKLTDMCRNLSKQDYIKCIERTCGIKIDDFFQINYAGEFPARAIETYCPEGITIDINDIEKIAINQILSTDESEEDLYKYAFLDENNEYIGRNELDYLSNFANFVYYKRENDEFYKIFPDEFGNPKNIDENGNPVLDTEKLNMYVRFDFTPTNNIDESQYQKYTDIEAANFKKEAYAARIYNINNICNTNYNEEKHTTVLNSHQAQAYMRIRHAYEDQSISRGNNVIEVAKKLISQLAKHPEDIFSDKTEALLKECQEKNMVSSSCENLAVLLSEMYPEISPVQYGDYININNDVFNMTTIPDPYHPVNEYSLISQMKWLVYGGEYYE